MNKIIALLCVLSLAACANSVGPTEVVDAATPDTGSDAASDANNVADDSVIVADVADSSDASDTSLQTDTVSDAPVAPVLTVTFNGPPAGRVRRGSQDVPFFRYSLAALREVEIRPLSFRIVGLTANDYIRGSAGTDYFRDLKLKDMDTGATVLGPMALPSGLANGATNSGLMTLTDALTIRTLNIRNLGFTFDTSNTEDAPGEFFSGTHAYRVIVEDGSGHFFDAMAVRDVATGEFVSPEAIVNNVPISGNPQTIEDTGGLTVSLAASPTSSTVVRNQPNIPSVGLVFTASPVSRALIRSVQLTGVGDVSGTFVHTHLRQVVTSCALYDGATQVGLAGSPDDTRGVVNLTNMNVRVPRGTSLGLELRCTADSVVAQAGGDRYALGIEFATHVVAEDESGNPIVPTLASGVVANSTYTPLVIVTVRQGGTISLVQDSDGGFRREDRIMTPRSVAWQRLNRICVQAQYEPVDFPRLDVVSLGNFASYIEVAIAFEGGILGRDVLPAGTNSYRDIDLSTNPIRVEIVRPTCFELWARLAEVVPNVSSGARSGASVALGINMGLETGEWDVNYRGRYNARAIGRVSGERLYATAPHATATFPTPYVVYKSRLRIEGLPLASTTLVNGTEMSLFHWRTLTDTGTASWKQMSLYLGAGPGRHYQATNLRLMLGSSVLSRADVRIVDGRTGQDVTDGILEIEGGVPLRTIVTMVWTGEELVSPSGMEYTLVGTISTSLVAGDTLRVNTFYNSVSEYEQTGTFYLTRANATGTFDRDTSPWSSMGSSGTGSLPGPSLIWSDMSEAPLHFARPGVDGGSRDWIGGAFLIDIISFDFHR